MVPAIHKNLKDEEILVYSVEKPNLFEVIIDRYQKPFLRVTQRIIGNKQEAEDICQDAFVKIYFNAKKFKKQPGASFKSWAYKILLNTAFMRYRKLKRDLGNVSYRDDILANEELLKLANADSDQTLIELKDLIESTFSAMPEDLSRMLKQHYLEDKSYKAMATTNNTTLYAIRMKIFRARKLFKKILTSSLSL